jgi:mannose-6-phosphate isomerase
VYKLKPVIKDYDWGSSSKLDSYVASDDKPESGIIAEIWYGAHCSGDAQLQDADGNSLNVTLSQYIKREPRNALGNECLERYGPILPFLLKLLAIDKNLSIQVHPEGYIAREGFNRENRAGIENNSPLRTFRDTGVKAEMLLALDTSLAAVGFAPCSEILERLNGLTGTIIEDLREILEIHRSSFGIKKCLEYILELDCTDEVISDFNDVLNQVRTRLSSHNPDLSYEIMLSAAADFDNTDITSLVILLMNCTELVSGEAVYLPAGQIHCYHRGFGVEIMANSDNVIRAGLTTKNIDKPALLRSTDFTEQEDFKESANHVHVSQTPNLDQYTPDIWDFAMTSGELCLNENLAAGLPEKGPRIVLCTSGEIRCEKFNLKQGEAVFVSDKDRELSITGITMDSNFVVAWCW